MQIYVGKNGQQLGPFSLEEINRKLADGTFVGSDLAWYEGAAGWAALSGVPGVVIPTAPAPAAVAPAPAPAPVRPAPAPVVAAPIRPNAPIVQAPQSTYKRLAVVSWVLLGITLVVSIIPFIGCGAWFLVWPVAVAAIIMGIIILVRGGTGQGIMVILGAVLIVPLCFLGQFLSLALFGGTIERREQTQIMENLRTIDTAKIKWVSDTKPAPGASVTIATLTSQLSGKTITPVVGEEYDPMPVGQPPTATLPANKTLGTFSGGEVLTAASIEKALASTSPFSLNLRKTSPTPSAAPLTSPKPTAKPTTAPSVAPSVQPSVAPSAPPSASPRPSASARPSTSPRSLISPRQRPHETPSSRPSPSAKFAPRNGPRETPSSNDEKSGGLKQGRKYPRESPGESPSESPEATPDDDDDDDNGDN